MEAMFVIGPIIVLLGTLTGVANGAVSGLLLKNLLKKEGGRIQNDNKDERRAR
jgi:hypothetical protein